MARPLKKNTLPPPYVPSAPSWPPCKDISLHSTPLVLHQQCLAAPTRQAGETGAMALGWAPRAVDGSPQHTTGAGKSLV